MYKIEPITSEHDLRSFECGEVSLNRFLKSYALKNDRNNIGKTFVAVTEDAPIVLGFYTLSGGSVKFDTLPTDVELPRYPIPTAHLGRLATDRSVRGRGLGEALLFDALKRAAEISNDLGIHIVELFALNEKAKSFYLQYGFRELADDQLHLYMKMETVKQLIS